MKLVKKILIWIAVAAIAFILIWMLWWFLSQNSAAPKDKPNMILDWLLVIALAFGCVAVFVAWWFKDKLWPKEDSEHEESHNPHVEHEHEDEHDSHGHDHVKKDGCWPTIWKIIKIIFITLLVALAFGGTLYWLYMHEFIWENAPKKIHHVVTEEDAKKVFWQWKMFDSKGKVVKNPSGGKLEGSEMTIKEMTRSCFEFSYGIGGQSQNRVVFRQIIALGQQGTWSCKATNEHGVWEVKPLDYDPTRPGRGFRAYIWDSEIEEPSLENAYELLALPSDVLRPSAM